MGAKLDYEEIKTLSHTLPKEIVYTSLIINMCLMALMLFVMVMHIFNLMA